MAHHSNVVMITKVAAHMFQVINVVNAYTDRSFLTC